MSSYERLNSDQGVESERQRCSNTNKISLFVWIAVLILVGSVSGALTRSQIKNWYTTLNRSPLTPPNIVFPIAWTTLYTMIAICGWMIWKAPLFPKIKLIKELYVLQLILNWSWTPLFFSFHLTGCSLLVIVIMDVAVSLIIYLAYQNLRKVSYLMTPYLLWILFATYLNFYIWQHN
ncbi:unnamed protein product [Blepharisma stoltei]|uniref:Tryptophan-rich sensory protein n=1 Tax=Blepharisma stoltei TaxID=1481888 RepID=A0AAU9JY71_9CILI|nr:unnamed protein product [Blepharisma stoltei]